MDGSGELPRGGLLALDLSRRTGWAIYPTSFRPSPFAMPRPDCAVVRYGMHLLAKDGAPMEEAFSELDRWLTRTLLPKAAPCLIAVEAPFLPLRGRSSQVVVTTLHGLFAIAAMHAHRLNIPMHRLNANQVKHHWTRSGHADKDVMIDYAKRRGFSPQDDNAADALAVGDMLISRLAGTRDWPPRERQERSYDREGTA